MVHSGPWWSRWSLFARSVELKAVSLQSTVTELRGDLQASSLHNEKLRIPGTKRKNMVKHENTTKLHNYRKLKEIQTFERH
jgi:hypothetical protein